MSNYTDASFKKDIRQLERLINGFSTHANKSMHGGKKSSKSPKERKESVTSGMRSFRIVSVNGKATAMGRYTLKPGKDPRDAGVRAFRQLCKKHGMEKSEKCKFNFSLQETTRGSKHKVYSYVGKRAKLDKPRKHKFPGSSKVAVFTFKNIVKAAGQKGGWAFYN
jgi:hypothetical protein